MSRAGEFEELRPLLFSIAYPILGSAASPSCSYGPYLTDYFLRSGAHQSVRASGEP